jgi:iron complex outermembrane receptor protein
MEADGAPELPRAPLPPVWGRPRPVIVPTALLLSLLAPVAMAADSEEAAPGAGGAAPRNAPRGPGDATHDAAEEIEVAQAHPGPDPIQVSAALTRVTLGPELPAGADLAQVLSTVPGTLVRRLGGLGDPAVVSMRGSTVRQVEVFLDGVPLNPDGADVVDLSELPARAFATLDAWRGHAPARYGTSAIGGVVDLHLPRHAIPATGGVDVGSWTTARFWALGGGAIGPARAFVAVDGQSTRGDFTWLDDRGTRYTPGDDAIVRRTHNASRRAGVLARVEAGGARARVSVHDSVAFSDRELPGPSQDSAAHATYGATRNLLAVSGDLRPTDTLRLQPRGWWLTRTDRFVDREAELGVGAHDRADMTDARAAQLEGTWIPDPRLRLGTLVRARREVWTPVDALAEAGTSRTRLAGTAAMSADLSDARGRGTLTPALVAERLQDDDGATVVPTTSVSPRLGVLMRPFGTLALKGNAGSYLRPPDTLERFGDRGTSVGNPDLRPERGVSWDVGARWVGTLGGGDAAPACFALDATWASIDATDRIAWVQNSQRTTRAVNLDHARIRAAEVGLEVESGHWLASRTALTHTRAVNLSEDPAYAGNDLPRLPAWDVQQLTTLRVPVRAGWTASLGHAWSLTTATWLEAANLERTAPRSLHALAARVDPPATGVSVSLDVRNALDTHAALVDRNPLSDRDDTPVPQGLTDFAGYPLPGRTVLVSLAWTPGPPSTRSAP